MEEFSPHKEYTDFMEALGLLLAEPFTSEGLHKKGSTWHLLCGSSFVFTYRSHRLLQAWTEYLAFSIPNREDHQKCVVKQRLL